MKSLLALSFIPLLTITSHAQTEQWGQVYFGNAFQTDPPADRRVYLGTSPCVGSYHAAQLYYGTNISNLLPLTSPPATFRNIPATDLNAGTWIGGMRTLVGIPPGTQTYLLVFFWHTDAGATFEEASRNNGPYRWVSSVFTYVPPPPGSSLEAHYMEGFRAVSSHCGLNAYLAGILVQPTNQVVHAGEDVVISVVSTNSCGHLWQFNGTNISDPNLPGSRFLVLTNVQPSQAGDYRVIVGSPPFGHPLVFKRTSEVARLTVEPPPQWGEVDFNNTRTFSTAADRLLRFPDYSPVVGTNFVVQLYYGTNAASLIPVPSPPLRCRNVQPSDPLAGTWSGARRTLVGMSPGTTATLQVRLWDSDWGSTYQEAQTNGSRFHGQSTTFTYRVPPHGSSPLDYYIEGFRAFSTHCPPIFGPPAFLSQPADQVAYIGQTVIFPNVTTNICMIHWQFNGTNLFSGRFGPLRINNVQLQHEGDYRVIVPAIGGTSAMTSQVARLTVRPAPQLTSSRYDSGAFAFQVLENTGNAVVIETAPNLNPATTWTPLFTNTAPFWFTNSTPADRQRFYRTRF